MREVVAFVLVLFAAPAWASDPCECPRSHVRDYFAWDGASDPVQVPQNVTFFVAALRQAEYSITTESGTPVELEANPLTEAPDIVAIRPRGLVAETNYWLERGAARLPFVTASGPDNAPPPLGEVNVSGTRLGGACPEHLAAIATHSLYVELRDVWTAHEFTHEGALQRVELRDLDTGAVQVLYPSFGAFGCMEGAPCLKGSGIDAEHRYEAVVSVFDHAGNESERSAPLPFTFKENEDFSACQAGTSDTGAPAALALLLGAVAWRRRRRLSSAPGGA